MYITNHSKKRCKDRLGLSKGETEIIAERAIAEGISYNSAKGSLKRYIGYLYEKHNRQASNIRIYNQKIFLFTSEFGLITILELPTRYKKYKI